MEAEDKAVHSATVTSTAAGDKEEQRLRNRISARKRFHQHVSSSSLTEEGGGAHHDASTDERPGGESLAKSGRDQDKNDARANPKVEESSEGVGIGERKRNRPRETETETRRGLEADPPTKQQRARGRKKKRERRRISREVRRMGGPSPGRGPGPGPSEGGGFGPGPRGAPPREDRFGRYHGGPPDRRGPGRGRGPPGHYPPPMRGGSPYGGGPPPHWRGGPPPHGRHDYRPQSYDGGPHRRRASWSQNRSRSPRGRYGHEYDRRSRSRNSAYSSDESSRSRSPGRSRSRTHSRSGSRSLSRSRSRSISQSRSRSRSRSPSGSRSRSPSRSRSKSRSPSRSNSRSLSRSRSRSRSGSRSPPRSKSRSPSPVKIKLEDETEVDGNAVRSLDKDHSPRARSGSKSRSQESQSRRSVNSRERERHHRRSTSSSRRGRRRDRGGRDSERTRNNYSSRRKRSRSYSSDSYQSSRSSSSGSSRSSYKDHRDRKRRAKETDASLSAFTRDQCTVFVTQLVMRATERDVKRYFRKKAGCKVNDVIMLRDRRTGRHKGSAYVQLHSIEDVVKALQASGKPPDFQRFPILVKASEAEKNYAAPATSTTLTATMMGSPPVSSSPLLDADGNVVESQKVYVGGLDPTVSEEHLFAIFSQFGHLEKVTMQADPSTQSSRGYAFLSFRDPKIANLAIQTMSNQVLAGRPMKTGWASQTSSSHGAEVVTSGEYPPDADILTQKAYTVLAQLTGSTVPSALSNAAISAASVVSSAAEAAIEAAMGNAVEVGSIPTVAEARASMAASMNSPLPTVAPSAQAPVSSLLPPPQDPSKAVGGAENPTRNILVHNMFDKDTETEPEWQNEIRLDFEEECSQFGKLERVVVMHKEVGGKIFARFESVEGASKCAHNLAGRWFDKRRLRVDFVSDDTFPPKEN